MILWYSTRENFFGKNLVTSLQNGKMVIMCSEDIGDEGRWAGQLGVMNEDIEDVRHLLLTILPTNDRAQEQY